MRTRSAGYGFQVRPRKGSEFPSLFSIYIKINEKKTVSLKDRRDCLALFLVLFVNDWIVRNDRRDEENQNCHENGNNGT